MKIKGNIINRDRIIVELFTIFTLGGSCMFREALELNTNQILENPFLVADFIFEEEKREQLSSCDPETLKEFLSYFENEENFKRIVKLFNGVHYENYYDFRHGNGQFKVVVQGIIQGVAHAPVFAISRAIVNYFYGNGAIKGEVEIFISEIEKALDTALEEEEAYKNSVIRNLMGHLNRVDNKL